MSPQAQCAVHPEVMAEAFCRTCGTPVCGACVRDVRGVKYCENCLANSVAGVPPIPGATVASSDLPSPGLAAVLAAFLPGVGAMYNGEFLKGFVHMLVFGTLIWMASEINQMEAIFGMLVAAWWFYMIFDAYKTAKARRTGEPVPDPFGLNRSLRPREYYGATPTDAARAAVAQPAGSNAPLGAIILIGLGVLFLMNNLGLFDFRIRRFWPVILIAIGVYLFMQRMGMVRPDTDPADTTAQKEGQ